MLVLMPIHLCRIARASTRLPSLTKNWSPICLAVVLLLVFLPGLAGQASHKENNNNEVPAAKLANVQQELVRIEMGFFEAWKSDDEAYFREHMPEDGIFWGESGVLSRDEELQRQQASAKTCKVEGYSLSDFGALPLVTGAYLLTYKAEQYATCNGEKTPVHMNGSSIYVFKAGRWQAIYRAEVPVEGQS